MAPDRRFIADELDLARAELAAFMDELPQKRAKGAAAVHQSRIAIDESRALLARVNILLKHEPITQ